MENQTKNRMENDMKAGFVWIIAGLMVPGSFHDYGMAFLE